MIQEISKMLNQSRSGNSHVTSQPVSFPPHPIPGGMLSRSIGMPSRREGPPSIWDTHGNSGNVFANPVASSSAPSPQELNPWSSGREEPIHSSTVEKSEKQTPVQDQRCQSGPSAKSSVIFSGGDCRFQIFISTNSLHGAPSTLTPEEREFVVDSGASMHMISKKDLNSAEMDTLTNSCSPTIVITANGEVQTHEEATVYVKEIGHILDHESPRTHASSIVAGKALR